MAVCRWGTRRPALPALPQVDVPHLDVAAAIGARVVAQGVRVSDGVTREKTGDGQLHTLRHAARTARSYWWRRQRGGVV